jgi:hypothetical protein
MNRNKSSRSVVSFIAAGAMISGVLGCSSKSATQSEITDKNLVKEGGPSLFRTIGDAKHEYTVLSKALLQSKVAQGEYTASDSQIASAALSETLEHSALVTRSARFAVKPRPRQFISEDASGPDLLGDSKNALIFGMPLTMFNKPLVFGAVVTQVSDHKSEDLGGVKLANIPPFQVVSYLNRDKTGKYSVILLDCGADCTKTENLKPIFQLPITAVDNKKGVVFVDLAQLGEGLDFRAIHQGDPAFDSFKSKSSKTVKFDYSKSTLVFDVEAHLIDAKADVLDPLVNETVITNRWYLRDESDLNKSFVARKPTPGVGFFLTAKKDAEPMIQRWDFDQRDAEQGIKYYIKNVPVEYQAAFAGSFDEWNEKLLPMLGKKVFDYEFISASDPRNEMLVSGDIRYNILEWDLVNKASYGGLGPSNANPYSGQVYQANVMIQGPTCVGLYTRWFQVSKTVQDLRAAGRDAEANAVLLQGQRDMQDRVQSLKGRTFALKVGDREMNIRSQDPTLEDPMMNKEGFDLVPDGFEYDTYMAGYFHDMVTHELGHDLGLRHNFRGNLGATSGKAQLGQVSRSVMEYLGRGYRHLDHIGEYDLMAIAYGYTGKAPDHLDWYCTDEDSADLKDPTKSAECTSNDATDDPYSYFAGRLNRSVDLIVGRGLTSAPDWTVDDMKEQLKQVLVGLGSYSVSAEKTYSSWTNFYNGADRPHQASDVRAYVLATLKSSICDPSLAAEVTAKATPDAQVKTQANLDAFRAKVAETLLPAFKAEELACVSTVAHQ